MRICCWLKNSEENQPLLANTGDNALHHAVRHARSAQDIIAFRETLDVEAAAVELAVSVNNDNKLPIELLFENPYLNKDDKNIAFALLIALTIKHTSMPLAEALNREEILQQYAYLGEANKQYQNIKILCDIANEVRTSIKASCTHPEINSLEDSTKLLLAKEINSDRSIETC